MKILIIGGAGFIGCNVADFYLKRGNYVILLDNFSREGTILNLQWLLSKYKKNLEVHFCDIRIDTDEIANCCKRSNVVFHFAAQVAVTTSVINPMLDFQVNALGTFNVLEAIRKSPNKPILIFSSTNKVYGAMKDEKVIEKKKRYEYDNLSEGVSENQNLDFHSPYGCSKGAADQYVRDYSRIYGLRTVIFRQSCIYGTRQFGVEDQGWVAHFIIAAIFNREITIYGTGKQVRDILFISDLVSAYECALKKINKISGEIYNIGGGPENTLSLLELIEFLENHLHKKIKYKFSKWRPGDQLVFICNIKKAKKDFGWEPKVNVNTGLKKLIDWVSENKDLWEKKF